MTPLEFEKYVIELLRNEGISIGSLSVEHLQTLSVADGDYTFDGLGKFKLLDVEFTILIECKRLSRPVERDVVIILNQKLQSTGSQKGIIFSTSGFQRGAEIFAKEHGIALIEIQPNSGEKLIVTPIRFGPDLNTRNPILDRFTATLRSSPCGAKFIILGWGGVTLRKVFSRETH